MQRIIIRVSDIEIILNKDKEEAKNLLSKIRKALGKSPNDPVSVGQFCDCIHVPEEEVRKVIAEQDAN